MENKNFGSLGKNKIKSFPKVLIGNLRRLGTTIRRGSSIETFGDDSKKYNSHSKLDLESHRFFDNYGFTLIELLVVVLIIGILAAVSVPQYQLAVDKTRAKTILAIMDSVKKAETVYRLANGQYTLDFTELDIDLPTNSEGHSTIRTTDGTTYSLSSDGTYTHVTGAPKNWAFNLYSALSVDDYMCYPQGKERGRRVCKSLGCSESAIHQQYCSFTKYR